MNSAFGKLKSCTISKYPRLNFPAKKHVLFFEKTKTEQHEASEEI